MVDSTQLPNVDINAIATDLNNKIDRDGVNITNSFLNQLMPDYTTKVEISTSGYTCSYPCYCSIRSKHSDDNNDRQVYVNNVYIGNIRDQIYGTGNNADVNMCFHCATGDVITWDGEAFLYVFKLRGAE